MNAQTFTKGTALTYACENGHTEVAEVLIHHGAELVSFRCSVLDSLSRLLHGRIKTKLGLMLQSIKGPIFLPPLSLPSPFLCPVLSPLFTLRRRPSIVAVGSVEAHSLL